ncbi:MAG: hypothetical protein JRJ42_02655 [Deltaproteobacteria bacterium]|nr:hypothetical protein [Deltaproteobacteria bacterium]MBW2018489.1 hypothetical protein [Deltaproteobacteria bacterium]MBW2073224.1 hypothetical protein [Deltaproteobacteria bacterium]RLB83280.1 MAG: hypothetical protein DRH17_02540 [Deltaproteobacteria bacterium]
MVYHYETAKWLKEVNDKTIKVLLVEDNSGDVRLIQEMLAEVKGGGFGLAWAEKPSTGLEHLAEGGIDLCLLDLLLPETGALKRLVPRILNRRTCRSRSTLQNIPC